MPKHDSEKVTWLAGPLEYPGIYRRVERSLSTLQRIVRTARLLQIGII